MGQIRKRLLITIDFLIETGDDAAFLSNARKSVESAYDKKNISGLRHAIKDVQSWTEDLTENELKELQKRLLEKVNIDISKEQDENLAIIAAIIERGSIKNDREYEMLLDRVEAIYEDNTMSDEVKKINELLAEYYSSSGKTTGR